ncbi:MAG: hypothetical protein AB7K64_05790 [Variibacter sp.]
MADVCHPVTSVRVRLSKRNGVSRLDVAAAWLPYAAAPTFALMALATALSGASGMLCTSAHAASPLTGMAAMYLLMSAFHCAPWLRLISRRRGRGM